MRPCRSSVGHARTFELVVVSLVLCGGKDGQQTAAVVGGIVGVGGEFRFYFHSGVLSVAVEDEFEQREAAFVIEQLVVFIANEFGVELVEDGREQGDRRRGAFPTRRGRVGRASQARDSWPREQ